MKKISSRFSVAIHILSFLALRQSVLLTAELLSGSVNTNPVIVRKIIAKLKKAELVNVRRGVGGAYLYQDPDQITLLDVYRAVEVVEDDELFHCHRGANARCAVGAHFEEVFCSTVHKAQAAMEKELAQVTLKQFATRLSDKMNSVRD